MVIDIDESPLTNNQLYETPSVENHKERVILKLANTPEIEAVYASLDSIKKIVSYLPKLANDVEFIKPKLDRIDQEKVEELIRLIKQLNIPNLNVVADNIEKVNNISDNISILNSINMNKIQILEVYENIDKIDEVIAITDSINVVADLSDEIATLISFKNNIISINEDLDKILSVEKRLPYIITLAKLGQKYLTLQEEKDFTDAQFYDTLVSILEQVELLGTIKEHLPNILGLQETLDGLEDTLTQYQQLASEVVTETQGRIREIFGKYSERARDETNEGLKKIWDAIQTGLDLLKKASETSQKPEVDLSAYATTVFVEEKLNQLKHALETKLGNLYDLSTTAKTDLVSAINEVYSRTANSGGSFENLLTTNTVQSVTAVKTFTVLPQSISTPEDDKDFVTKKYVDTKQPDLSSVNSEIESLKQKAQQFEQSVNTITEAINGINSKVEQNTEKITTLQQKDTELNQEIQANKQSIETNKQSIEEIKTKLLEIKEVDNPNFINNEEDIDLGQYKYEIAIPEEKNIILNSVYFTKGNNVILTMLDTKLDSIKNKLIVYSDTQSIKKIIYTIY